MAKKRSVPVEETENNARAEIRRFGYRLQALHLGKRRLLCFASRRPSLNLSGFPHRGEITFCLWCRAPPRKMRSGVLVSTTLAIAKFVRPWNAHETPG